MFFVYIVWVFEYVLVVLGKTHLASEGNYGCGV